MICFMKDLLVRLESEEVLFFPAVEGYGNMIDDLMYFSHSFVGGKIYGLVGECGSGGWGISSLLCGKELKKRCRVFINGVQFSQNELKETGWYVGEGIERKQCFFKEMSVIEQIRHGLRISKKCDEDELIKSFRLTDKQLKMKISDLGSERWEISAVIGYAHNRNIFCFPWMNTGYYNDLMMNTGIERCLEILKREGNIVIIPVGKREPLDTIADEIIVMKNHRFEVCPRAKELIREYHRNGPPN